MGDDRNFQDNSRNKLPLLDIHGEQLKEAYALQWSNRGTNDNADDTRYLNREITITESSHFFFQLNKPNIDFEN